MHKCKCGMRINNLIRNLNKVYLIYQNVEEYMNTIINYIELGHNNCLMNI